MSLHRLADFEVLSPIAGKQHEHSSRFQVCIGISVVGLGTRLWVQDVCR